MSDRKVSKTPAPIEALRPAYRAVPVCLDIVALATLDPASLVQGPVIVHAESKTPAPFKPEKAIAHVAVVATYGGPGLPDEERAWLIEGGALDAFVLTGARLDRTTLGPPPAKGCTEGGVPFSAFAATSLGGGISYPAVTDQLSVDIQIMPALLDVLERARLDMERPLPPGYEERPRCITASIRLSWYGSALR